MTRTAPSSSDNVIDSRDVIARIQELEGMDEPDAEEIEELASLNELQDQASGYSDWQHGATLISDDYFQTYAQELADDIGAVSKDAGWPNQHIDWEAAADELKHDYTSVEFDGTTFWLR